MGRPREIVCSLMRGNFPVARLAPIVVRLSVEEDLALRLPGSSVTIRPMFTYAGGQGKPPWVRVRPTGMKVCLPAGLVTVFPINTPDIVLASGETLEVSITITTE